MGKQFGSWLRAVAINHRRTSNLYWHSSSSNSEDSDHSNSRVAPPFIEVGKQGRIFSIGDTEDKGENHGDMITNKIDTIQKVVN